MSSQRGAWITRRGQTGVEAAIDQVLDHQPQPGEHVQQAPDELIEDSPYQARQPFNEENVEELAQGMREVGFQGVLIVRPHSDASKRRRGVFQLVYGHRRRAAWCRVCIERDVACLLPVVVREVSDERMLLIGAQENVQRQDLDPVEEAQIVAWLQRMFPQQNQAELGALLGKSSDWVSVRARIYKLPDELKVRLRQRPRAIKQMLELASLYPEHSAFVLALADRVVQENLTVERVRTLIRTQQEQEGQASVREERRNRRAGATFVPDITSYTVNHATGSAPLPKHETLEPATVPPNGDALSTPTLLSPVTSPTAPLGEPQASGISSGGDASNVDALGLLQRTAGTLSALVCRADELPANTHTEQALAQAEHALLLLRQVLLPPAMGDSADDEIA